MQRVFSWMSSAGGSVDVEDWRYRRLLEFDLIECSIFACSMPPYYPYKIWRHWLIEFLSVKQRRGSAKAVFREEGWHYAGGCMAWPDLKWGRRTRRDLWPLLPAPFTCSECFWIMGDGTLLAWMSGTSLSISTSITTSTATCQWLHWNLRSKTAINWHARHESEGKWHLS